MKTIKVLGSGCHSCQKAYDLISQVLREENAQAELIKVEGFAEIMRYPIASTPAFVVDEQVVLYGRIPTAGEVKAWLGEGCACAPGPGSCC